MKRSVLSLILCLLPVFFVSCAAITENDPPALTQTAAWEGENAAVVLSLPEDWSWNYFPENEEDAHLGYGIRFYPADDPGASTVIRFDTGFGVCGTGLKTEKITLAGGTRITSYSWNGATPSLYRFNGTPGTYLAELQMDEAQRKQYFDTVMQILDKVSLGGDIIREEAAVALTGHTDGDTRRIYADFDETRAVWVINVYSKETKPETHIFTYEVSADGTDIQITFKRS